MINEEDHMKAILVMALSEKMLLLVRGGLGGFTCLFHVSEPAVPLRQLIP